jgi:hypothetical protein
MQMLGAGIAGDIEHADEMAVGIVDRRRVAGQDAVGGAVVFAAAHFHRAAFDDGGADRIGADLRFVPAGARHQCDASC